MAYLVTFSMTAGIRERVESVGGRAGLAKRLGDVNL